MARNKLASNRTSVEIFNMILESDFGLFEGKLSTIHKKRVEDLIRIKFLKRMNGNIIFDEAGRKYYDTYIKKETVINNQLNANEIALYNSWLGNKTPWFHHGVSFFAFSNAGTESDKKGLVFSVIGKDGSLKDRDGNIRLVNGLERFDNFCQNFIVDHITIQITRYQPLDVIEEALKMAEAIVQVITHDENPESECFPCLADKDWVLIEELEWNRNAVNPDRVCLWMRRPVDKTINFHYQYTETPIKKKCPGATVLLFESKGLDGLDSPYSFFTTPQVFDNYQKLISYYSNSDEYQLVFPLIAYESTWNIIPNTVWENAYVVYGTSDIRKDQFSQEWEEAYPGTTTPVFCSRFQEVIAKHTATGSSKKLLFIGDHLFLDIIAGCITETIVANLGNDVAINSAILPNHAVSQGVREVIEDIELVALT